MIERMIRDIEGYRRREREEDDFLLELRTEAQGVGSPKYGDDTSHGTGDGDHMETAVIRLVEAQKEIDTKRIPRFEITAETCDWFYDKLKPIPARIMTLYVVDGLSYREIASKTGRSVGWVSNIVSNAKKKLK